MVREAFGFSTKEKLLLDERLYVKSWKSNPDKTEEEGSVVMTTKTVQFGLDGPQETVLKSAMSSHPEKKVKDVYSAPLLPSTIKKQKVSSTDILDCFFSFSA